MRLPRARFTMQQVKVASAVGLMLASGPVLGGGCSQQRARDAVYRAKEETRQASDGRPTIAEAQEALLAALRSNRLSDLWRVNPDKLSREAERPAGVDSTWFRGPFRIDLRDKSYSYTVFYGADRKCAIVYAGTFESRQGRWLAISPDP